MAGAGEAAGLARARDVIVATMKHKASRLLFNQPVDPALFPEYRKVVAQPMDLGTILGRLREGEASGWQRCAYGSPADVAADVALIWANCDAFNCTPADAPTRAMAAEVRGAFERKWAAVGLAAPAPRAARPAAGEHVAEADVPDTFTAGRGGPRPGSCGCVLMQAAVAGRIRHGRLAACCAASFLLRTVQLSSALTCRAHMVGDLRRAPRHERGQALRHPARGERVPGLAVCLRRPDNPRAP